MLKLLGILHLIQFVYGDYCESNWCDDETEYCCGKNKCCKTLDLWFLWATILIVIFVLAVIMICRKMRHNNKYEPYQQVSHVDEAMT